MINVKKNEKGFTLTELIIVIVIIGILAAVLIPSLTVYIGKAKESAAITDAQTILEEYKADLVERNETDKYVAVINTKNVIVLSGDYCVLFVEGSYSKLSKTTEFTTAADNTHLNVASQGYSTLKLDGSTFTWTDVPSA